MQTTLHLYETAASLRLIQSNWLALFFTHGALSEYLGTLFAYTQVTYAVASHSLLLNFCNTHLPQF